MKYKNKVYLGESNVTERELKRLNITETKSKAFRAEQIKEKIAFDVMLWLKYYRMVSKITNSSLIVKVNMIM